jgi:hypothetical protein
LAKAKGSDRKNKNSRLLHSERRTAFVWLDRAQFVRDGMTKRKGMAKASGKDRVIVAFSAISTGRNFLNLKKGCSGNPALLFSVAFMKIKKWERLLKPASSPGFPRPRL